MSALPDLVYVVRSGENEELRHSLRSVERYADGLFRHIWVVGTGLPDWLTGVKIITIDDGPEKHETMRRKIQAATDHPDVSDNFLLMNDDYFLTRKINAWETYHMGLAREWIAERLRRRNGQWSTYLRDVNMTVAWLADHGHPDVLVRETHSPTWWDKQALGEMLRLYPGGRPITVVELWDICGHGPDGGRVRNAKVHDDGGLEAAYSDGRNPWLSSSDTSFSETRIGVDIRAMFPNTSRFEA